jgi:hypothetical protein
MSKSRAPDGGFVISNEVDERLFVEYIRQRDLVRSVMGGGVYPNLVKALEVYAAFDLALAEGGPLADAELLVYHGALLAPIAPYITALREAAAGIVATMQAIEAASPGTFGIPLGSTA